MKYLYQNSLFLAFLMQLVLTGCGKKEAEAPKTPVKPLEERIESVVKPLVDYGWAKGVIVGVTQLGQEQFFSFGNTGDDSGNKLDKDTVFEIGSITKVFTSILLAEMAKNGEVSLDDSVAKYVPSGWDSADIETSGMTLLDLATHSSGLPVIAANFWKEGDNIYDINTGGKRWQAYQSNDLQEFLANPIPPLSQKGNYVYSNLGIGLLGFILEQKAEPPLSDLIEDRICKPLGMLDTSFSATPSVSGFNHDGEIVDFWEHGDSVLGGAYALKSTASDMLKFARASLDPASSPINEVLSIAQKPQFQINEYEQSAMGWKVNKFGVVYSSGATGGFRSALFLHPQSKTGIVLLANTQVGGVVGSTALLFDTIAGSLLNVTLNAAPIQIQIPTTSRVDDSVLQDYVGYFEPDNGEADPSFPVRIQDGKLMTQGPGEMPMRLWSAGKDVFFLRAYASMLQFQRDESGKVSGVLLEFEGQKANLIKRSE